jgi:hypothetical protein
MKRRTRRIILAVALIGALAAGGAAFTASNTFSTADVAGYGTQAVSGATIADQVNNLNAMGTEITSVDLTFTASQANMTVQGGFSDETALDSCTDSNPGTDTQWHCAITNGSGAGNYEVTANAANFAVTVTNT